MVHLKITPDSRLINDNAEQFAQTLCVYQSPLERWNGRGLNRIPYLSYETILSKNESSFVTTVPAEMESVARKAIETSWPNATISVIEDPLNTTPANASPTLTSALELNYHYMFAIRVDRRELTLLSSLLETVNTLEDNDAVYIQTLAIPAEPDWHESASGAYEKFRSGDMPSKIRLNKKMVTKSALKLTTGAVLGVIDVMTQFLSGEEADKINLNDGERAKILREGSLRKETLQKVRGDAYDVSIRIAVSCDYPARAKAIMRMVTMAFRELDGDNHLIAAESNPERTWRKMQERKPSIKTQKDYMSIAELSRLCLLPTKPLQERYNVDSNKLLENGIPDDVSANGMLLGEMTNKGVAKSVYFPTDNHDAVCLPSCVIGGMGSGKTKGFGANRAVEAVKNGFGAIIIDPAKGEMGDEIEKALPADKILRINVATLFPSMDFREYRHAKFADDLLADAMLKFFDTAEGAGFQTERYLESAVKLVGSDRIEDIEKVFLSKVFREAAIEKCDDEDAVSVWETYNKMSEGQQIAKAEPVLNRIYKIKGNSFLKRCLKSKNGIDFVELMREPKCIILDVPRKDVGPRSVEIICTLLSAKLDMAMCLRDKNEEIPWIAIFDEPHQYVKSAKIWESAAVESRKWRLGYVWLFHSWEQIPSKLQEIIRSAGPHYHIYRSSKKTFTDLREELAPYSIDDFIKMPKWHAINCLRVGDEQHVVFMAHMTAPPSEQKQQKQRGA